MLKPPLFILIPPIIEKPEPLDVQVCLMGAALVHAGRDAERYMAALQNGEIERLRRMLQASVDIGRTWAVRLADRK